MKCQNCGNEMTLGFVQCRDGLHWTPKMQLISAFSALGRGSVSLKNGAADDSRAVYAYRCSQCKLVVIPYGRDLNEEADG